MPRLHAIGKDFAIVAIDAGLRVGVRLQQLLHGASVFQTIWQRPVARAERHDFVQNKAITHVGKAELHVADKIRVICEIVPPGDIAVIALVRADIELVAFFLGCPQNRAYVLGRHTEFHGTERHIQQQRLLHRDAVLLSFCIGRRRFARTGCVFLRLGGRLFGSGFLCHIRRFGFHFLRGRLLRCRFHGHRRRLRRAAFCLENREARRKPDHQRAAGGKRRPFDPHSRLLPLCLRRRIGTLNQIVSHITDGAEQLFLSVLPCHTATPSFCKNLRSCSRVRNRMDLTVFSFSE